MPVPAQPARAGASVRLPPAPPPCPDPTAWPLTPALPPSRSYLDGSGRFALFRFPVKGTVRGVCIFVHGCKHDATSWFYKSKECPTCTGARARRRSS